MGDDLMSVTEDEDELYENDFRVTKFGEKQPLRNQSTQKKSLHKIQSRDSTALDNSRKKKELLLNDLFLTEMQDTINLLLTD
jgi:hypothetical protein